MKTIKIIHKISIIITVVGFILLIGLIGASDIEVETGVQMMTNKEFYLQMIIRTLMSLGGFCTAYICNNIIENKEHLNTVFKDNER